VRRARAGVCACVLCARARVQGCGCACARVVPVRVSVRVRVVRLRACACVCGNHARFFLAATLVVVRPGGYRCERVLILRDEATPALQCVFYAIDRPLPPLEKGQLVRLVNGTVLETD